MSSALTRDDLDRALVAFRCRGPRDGAAGVSNMMRALTETKTRARAFDGERARSPRSGPDDVLIRVRKTGVLRHRRSHLELGRMGSEDGAGCRSSSATSSPARSSNSAAT